MTRYSTTSSRWTALQTRDPLAADAFIYSVITTKIYCRPTCSSRLARRANVVFHDTPGKAEAAGFRACKRCRPNLTKNESDPQVLAVKKACGMVRREESEGMKWSVKGLAKEVGLTESHFCRVFKKVKSMTVGEYRMNIKLDMADKSAGNIKNMDALQPLYLDIVTSNLISNSVYESPAPALCASNSGHDWHNVRTLLTPETTPIDNTEPVITANGCGFGFSESWDEAENYFEFVDFDNPGTEDLDDQVVSQPDLLY